MDKVFNYRAGSDDPDNPWEEFWWWIAGEGDDGYYMMWINGETFHL